MCQPQAERCDKTQMNKADIPDLIDHGPVYREVGGMRGHSGGGG